MKLFKREPSIDHDYFNIVKSVYPKLIDSIDSTFLAFKENRDASKSFVEYFEIGGKTGTADQPKDGAYSDAKIKEFTGTI